ncbi:MULTISPECIES: alpha/beta fold hydrolase [unclassified Acinetobacter]|uniref:alpha/beta fold hydrolase n=1 Tax=unclassified Acinetobacter TaxID=196816 RepID=UPI002934CB0B|nr:MULTISPECIES: alpha/beta fold hydrolase [unclassified Acinetobacter]WOE33342.1 alpha/beta fold hydrolase [Acinetobacter sp. SAAs470]WOE37052.1 alpha/beta fold hydrolase [Acinetobacter sp. SAAs474]
MLTVFALTYTTVAIAKPQHPSAITSMILPAHKVDEILSVQAQHPKTSYSHAGEQLIITYYSRGIHGEPVVSSAMVLLPKGKAPTQGWPILAWAHGTTGVADTCAPSADYIGGPVNSYQQVADKALDDWLERGYAIVAPDYQGLGTPGDHPYMNATSQLHTIVDAVRALHHLKAKQVSNNWLVMGHSQGGAAALAVAAYGQKDAPELNLKGAIALAPGGYQYQGIAEYVQQNSQIDPQIAAFLPIVLLGAQAADPNLDPEQWVTPEMQNLLRQARKRCLSELQTEIKQAPQTIFKKDADLNPLLNYLKQQSIESMIPQVPLMLVQGDQDQLVDPRGISTYYQQICDAHKPVVYYSIANGDHRDAVRQSSVLSKDFLKQLNQGKIVNSCIKH